MAIRIDDEIQCLQCKKWFTFRESMSYVDQDFCSDECEGCFLKEVNKG